MKSVQIACLFVLFLSACDKAPVPAPSGRDSSARSASVAANAAPQANAPTCPAQDFDQFLTAFANDVDIQKAFVTQPLQSDSVDANAEPEPKPVTKMLSRADLHFPLMPDIQQQSHDGLKFSRTMVAPGEARVKLVKEDTDYQMSFFFRNDGCWQLYRIKDDSL